MSVTPRTALAPDTLKDRTVVLTGASDGIGRAAAAQYAAAGATLVMVGRNEAKTAAAAARIMSDTGSRLVTWEIADLARLDAIEDLLGRLRARHPHIHVLANNAGAIFLERELTADGLERTFALNHLSYVRLALGLLDHLAAAAAPGHPARIVNVSSGAHTNAQPDLNDLQLAQGFGGWRAYGNSKLFNIWFTRSLAARLDPAQVVVHALHPGVVSTRFATNNGGKGRFLRRMMDLISITPAQGADTLMWLSTAAEAAATTGGYWIERRVAQPSSTARDDVAAERLWQATAALLHLDATAMIRAAGVHAVP